MASQQEIREVMRIVIAHQISIGDIDTSDSKDGVRDKLRTKMREVAKALDAMDELFTEKEFTS